MKRFRVEHKSWDKPTITVQLNQPPYEDENVLSRIKWQKKDVTITEVYQGEIK